MFIPLRADDRLCPGIYVHGIVLDLSSTELRMLCGDKDLPSYKEIPPYEAQYFFKGFLQSRGYLNPDFKIKEEVLHVYPGKLNEVHSIDVNSESPKLANKIDNELDRIYENTLLTPTLLDDIESVAQEQLGYRGFPCAKVRSEAFVESGEVRIFLERTEKYNFGQLQKEKIEGLRPNALERYYPFSQEEKFDERLLELTEKRMVRAEVVQGTYFLKECLDESFSLSQRFIVGPPRSFRFGVGASTELGPFGRIKWSHNRYESMASILSASLQMSFRIQSLSLSADTYLWKESPRRSLLSQIELLRENYLEFKQTLFRVRPHFKWTRDAEGFHKLYTLGPTYESGNYESTEKEESKSFSTGIIEGGIVWTSHRYELFDIHPQAGQQYRINFDFREPSLGFPETILKTDSSLLQIGRLSEWGRGTLVGAARLSLGTTWVRDRVSLESLPPTVKFFGGGSDDVRGFNLNTLPNNQGLGALSRISFKLELRRTYLYKESLEGFTFLDGAYFGEEAWDIDPPFYYSPGLGLRWLSPIGLIQGYVSRAYKTQPFEDKGYFMYAGIGGLF